MQLMLATDDTRQ